MGYIAFHATLDNGRAVVLEGPDVTYWADNGPPTYAGPIDGLEVEHPDVLAELIRRELIRAT